MKFFRVTLKQYLLIIVVPFVLQGCATSYHSSGFSGGYSETQLDENVFSISFRGNGFTNRERVADFTLLRSAELTLQSGYTYFVVVSANNHTTNSTYTTPTTSHTTANAYGSNNYAYGNATTTSYGGQTYNISKPSSSNTIVCFKEKPKSGMSYNAIFLSKSIKKKYNIQP